MEFFFGNLPTIQIGPHNVMTTTSDYSTGLLCFVLSYLSGFFASIPFATDMKPSKKRDIMPYFGGIFNSIFTLTARWFFPSKFMPMIVVGNIIILLLAWKPTLTKLM